MEESGLKNSKIQNNYLKNRISRKLNTVVYFHCKSMSLDSIDIEIAKWKGSFEGLIKAQIFGFSVNS